MRARDVATKFSLLPRASLIFKCGRDGIDTIGLPISAYSFLSAHWQSVFFANPTTPKQVAVSLIIADHDINIPGGNVFYSALRGIIAIYGTSPVEFAERRLWRYAFGTRFDQLSVCGDALFIDNYPLFLGA